MNDRGYLALQEQTVVLATVRQGAHRPPLVRTTVAGACPVVGPPRALAGSSGGRLRSWGRPAAGPPRALSGSSGGRERHWGRHRRRRPGAGPDRHLVALIAAAVAVLLAAGISVVAFAAVATHAPRHDRRP